MSGGVAVDFSALSKAGTSLAAGLEQNRLSGIAEALGAKVQARDYAGAASDAFKAGDLQTGLSLVKLGESKAQTADFQKTFGGGGLAGVLGGGTGTPAPVAPTSEAGASAQADRNLAAFKTNDPVAPDLSPQQKALLNAIAGGESGGKYNVRYTPRGGRLFDLNGQHPGIAEAGPAGPSTAAGRYQFTKTTWDRLGGGDFSPENQDRRALLLAQQDYKSRTGRDLNADLSTEGFSPRIQKALSPTWAALGGNVGRHSATYAESLQRYGAGGGAPAGRTQVASADPSFMPQMPSAAAGVSASPTAQVFGGEVKAIPPESDPVPAEQRVQVAQAVPNVLAQAGMKPAAVAQVQAMAPGSPERIQYLVKAMSHPAAPEGFKDAAKAILANELQLSHLSEEQKAYQADVQQGYKGTTMEWRAAKAAALKGPAEEPAVIREYEYAVRKGFSGDLFEYKKKLAEAGSTKVVQNAGGGAEGEQDKVVQKDFGDLQVEHRKAAGQAVTSLANIRAARQIMQDPTFYSGTFGSLATEGKKALASIGLAAPDSARANEGFTKISAQSILDKAGGSFGGAFSNGDRDAIKMTAQNIDNTPAGNALILDMAERVAMRAQENHRQMIAYKTANKGRIDDGFLAQLDRFSQEHPLFAGLDIPGPRVEASPTRSPPAGQRDANAGGTLKAAPAATIQQAREALASGKRSSEQVIQKLKEMGYSSAGL